MKKNLSLEMFRQAEACDLARLSRIGLLAIPLLISAWQAAAVPGATVPWTTYEAEAMTIVGGTVLGPPPKAADKNVNITNTVDMEASGRLCVRLSAVGQSVELQAQAAANTLVVRYSVPDSAGGGGTDYTLSLYINGSFVRKVPVTSKYSWLYGYPVAWVNTPGDRPRNFYDEARLKDLSIVPGDLVRLQVDADDTAAYYVIDFVDLEQIAPPLTQPANSRSIMEYGAYGDGIHDDTTAIRTAVVSGGTLWFPPGDYLLTGSVAIPANTTIQGAGMWYTTFVGSPATYANEQGRVRFNGAGSNIHFADFAILGRLTLREDWMANDGFSEFFGVGSTISRVWVEHTKTGAWIANSLGMVISDCRFRNTLADGINLCKNCNSCIVTNCTARNTGDDAFAIWPAVYNGGGTNGYPPGYNVITHCTAQAAWFANGCGIYGAVNNRVEDSLFEDMPNGCGILIAGTFPVDTNVFGGITVAQRCNINRSGGCDPGWYWRGALTICPQGIDIKGLQISDLNISNSLSYAVQVVSPGGGVLSNAEMSRVTVSGYALGVRAYHPQDPWPYHTNYVDGVFGVLARNDAKGVLSVQDLVVNGTWINTVPTSGTDLADQSTQFAFNFVTTNISVTVQPNPTGRAFTVDGTTYTSAQIFTWLPGSGHILAAVSPQSGGTGIQHVWTSWSDGGAVSHTVTPLGDATYTANFTTQYYLTSSGGPGGSVSPGSGWFNAGATVPVTALPSSGYFFSGWTGSGSGSYSGGDNPASITMNGPVSQTAAFTVMTRVLSLGGSLAYGPVMVGSSSNRMVTLSNGGNSTLTVSSLGVPTGFTASWSGAIPAGGSTNVPVTFSPLTATNYGGTLTIYSDATSGGNTLNVSGMGVTPGNLVPVQSLAFAQQPLDTLQGASITPAVQVQALGTNGQPLADAVLTLSLGSGAGTLSGTLTRYTDSGGIANFNDLSLNQAGLKTLTAVAPLGGGLATNSSAFMVIGPVAALAFTTQPGQAVEDLPFGQQPVLKTVDQVGNPTTQGLPVSLPVQVKLFSGSGALLGTTAHDIGTAVSNGVIAFADLAIDTTGTGCQLAASASDLSAPPVSGAVLWLDASDPATLATNASRVQGWKNKGSGGAGASGTNLWFTQNTTTLQPWRTNQLNGKPVLTFSKNGSGNGVGCTFLGNLGQSAYTNGVDQMSYFLVARQLNNSVAWQGPVSFSANGQIDGKGTAGMVVLTDGSAGAPYPLGIQRNRFSTPMQADVASAPLNTAFALSFVDSAGSARLSILEPSGVTRTNTASIVNGISPYRYAITDVAIGGRLEPSPATVDNGWDGDIAEVLVYNTALGPLDRNTVETYLKNKWLLPAGALGLSNALSSPFTVLAPGGTPPSPSFLSFVVTGGGGVTGTYSSTIGFVYHVEVCTNLGGAPWTTVEGSVTNASQSATPFIDPTPMGSGSRFYRVVSP